MIALSIGAYARCILTLCPAILPILLITVDRKSLMCSIVTLYSVINLQPIMLFTQLMITATPFCLPVGVNCTVSTPLMCMCALPLRVAHACVQRMCVACVALLNPTLYSFDNFYNKNFFGSTFGKVLLAYVYQGLEHIFKKIKFVKCV